MALAALISAERETQDGGLVATLPLAGRALVERQARLAARAGARHIVLLVERLPASLTAAIDRLRREGIGIDVARGVGDAADRFHPEERLLLFASGAIADEALVARLAAAAAPALLVAADDPETSGWERIDASQCWAGLALIDGAMLRRTAARLGDWDLEATLLRQAVSAGARRLGIADGADTGPAPLAAIVVDASDAARMDRRLATTTAERRGGWPARLLYAPFATIVLPLLVPRRIEPLWLRIAATALTLLALPALWFGWPRTALGLAIAGGPIEAIAARLAAARLLGATSGRVIHAVRLAALAAVLLLLGWRLMLAGGGWGCPALAATAIATLFAISGLERIAALAAMDRRAWFADADALALALVPFAATGQWRFGIAAVLCYGFASLLVAEREMFAVAAKA